MSSRLPADLLRRSAEESSRLLALAYIDEVVRAQQRLSDPLDSEALHDFRVGLRRLRSCTRAYRSQLKGSVSKGMRRRLRELTQATNAGRDAEVQLGWLHQQAARLDASETEGLGWLIGRLEGRRFEALDTVTSEVARRFTKMAAKLRPRLQTFRMEVGTERGQERSSFGRVTGELVRRHTAQLAQKLGAVRRVEDASEAHAARIAAKRLRYLIEPVSRRARGVKALVGQLKTLQDLLGDLRDRQVLADEIASSLAALARSKAGRPLGPEPGLLALQALANEHAATSFADFEARWAHGRATRFFRRVDELGSELQHAAPSPAGDPRPAASPDLSDSIALQGRTAPVPLVLSRTGAHRSTR